MTARDVVILGGGLAGMSLALQLRARLPSLVITVIERNTFPVPVSAHKVGESTVEIGADYLATVVGLADHLRDAHLKKFGFRFFFSDGQPAIDAVTELGASDYLGTPGYQIDRGVLENHLAAMMPDKRIELISGARVRDVALADSRPHFVKFVSDEVEQEISTHWVIDASGRAGVMRQRLNLQTDNGHRANAVWFRMNCRIRVDDWSRDARWQARCVRPERWLSTNHLVGPGYWVWLIPLSTGAHSVGIVADAVMHPLREMNSFPRALDWLKIHQPQLADIVESASGQIMDFAALRHFSYGCRQVFSANRWALSGEAGLFLDPFYSPGTDFIAIANTFITELIARERAGDSIAVHAKVFEQLYFSFYESTLDLYRDQYPIFGHADAMTAKVIWDYAYYWGILAQFYFQRRLTDLTSLSRLKVELIALQAVNRELQKALRDWASVGASPNPPRMLDQAGLAWFAALNRGLTDSLDDGSFHERMRGNCALLGSLAREILARSRAAGAQGWGLDTALRAMPDLAGHHGELLFPGAAAVGSA